jgi:glycosyltransferase involved in cell wall biosynthesis
MTETKHPFFSIILPTYNRAHLLHTTIGSVLSQTFDDWELIVVDDGSKDNTKEVVEGIGDKRIKYIYQENAERCVARNNGIRNAKGEFVCFIDSDDQYLPHHLETVFSEIKTRNFEQGLYVTNVIRLHSGVQTKVPFDDASRYINNVCFVLMAKESIILARVSIHRDILKLEKFDEISKITISEDMELYVRILSKFPLFQINQHTVIYNLHENNSTNTKFNPFEGQLKSLKLIFNNKDVNKFIPKSIRNKKLSSCYQGIARYYELRKQWFTMTYYYLNSIFIDPKNESNKSKVYNILSGLKWVFKS